MVASVWLRGALRLPMTYGTIGSVTRKGALWSLRPTLQPTWRLQTRQCFHPGATTLAREGLKFQREVKKVTGKDMIKALSNYIWPKGISLLEQTLNFS